MSAHALPVVAVRGWIIGGALLIPSLVMAQGAPAALSAPALKASPAEEAIRAAVAQVIAAFNSGKPEELNKVLAAQAELEDESGVVHEGRDAIAALAKSFAERFPGAKIDAEVGTIRVLASRLALADVLRTTTTADGVDKALTRSSMTFFEEQGKWLLVAVRDLPAEEEFGPHARLEPLGWLVGSWVDESPESALEIVCRWSEDQNYLLVDYTTRVAGEIALKTSQRLGWDPLKQQIHSWMFDSDGGYGDGEWIRSGDNWTIKSNAVAPDGIVGSATFTLEPKSADKFVMKATHRVAGDTLEPDRETTVVRRPAAAPKAR